MEARTETAEISFGSRAQAGIIGGFVASVMMGLAVITVTSINFLQVPFFPLVGSMFGVSGPPSEVAITGLIWFLGLGILAGLIFSFAFTRYSVNKGLGFAVIGLILTAVVLAAETVPPLSGTLGQIGLGSSLALFVPLAVCYVIWGYVMGIISRRYFK